MTLIQVVLTAGIIIIAVYMYLRLRSTLLDLIHDPIFSDYRGRICNFQ